MSLSVDHSKWHVRRGIGELSRSYHFSGLQAPGATATLRLDCRLERSVGDYSIHPLLTLHLRPFRLLHETSLVMGLVTADQSKGQNVKVRACPIEGDRDTASLAVEGRQDVQKCLTAISSGKEMVFMLGNQTRPFVKLPLPNDGEFQRLYNETYERMARAQEAGTDGPYLTRFLLSVDALLDAARQRSFGTAFKYGRRRLAKTALDTFTQLKAATFGLTHYLKLSLRGVDGLLGAVTARRRSFAAAFKNGRRRPAKAALDALTRLKAATFGLTHYLKLSLRGVDGLLGAVTARRRSFAAAFKNGRRRLAKTALDTLTRLKAATFGLTRGYSFRESITALAERLKARTWARAAARAQDASRDDLFSKHSLRGVDALLGTTKTNQSALAPFKDRWRLLAKTDELIAPDPGRRPTSPSSRRFNGTRWVKVYRDWVALGVSVLAGVVIIVAISDSSSIQSASSSKPLSDSVASPSAPAQAAANVKIPAEPADYLVGPPDAANKELMNQAQTSAPTEVHLVTHAIGEVGTLKQNFVGCRESWQNDGLLELESKSSADECDVRLPAGTKVTVANIRADNNICVRFPDDSVCYWATGDVLKLSKLVPPTPKVHPVKAKLAKAHPATRRDDDQLDFLFNR